MRTACYLNPSFKYFTYVNEICKKPIFMFPFADSYIDHLSPFLKLTITQCCKEENILFVPKNAPSRT